MSHNTPAATGPELGSLDDMLAEAGDVDGVLERILGETLPGSVAGCSAGASPTVLHVAAVAPVDGGRRVLRINEQTPGSPVDFFLLNATRAWADVVLTSGKILRDEPALSFDLDGPSARAVESLNEARQQRTAHAVKVGALSSGAGLDEGMPIWSSGADFTLITSPEGAARSSGWAGRAGVAVQALDPVNPRAAVEWARGWNRISVEFGARSSSELYGHADDGKASLVDVLVLSEFLGAVPKAVLGDEFLPGIDLERLYEPGPVTRGGDWCFRIWKLR